MHALNEGCRIAGALHNTGEGGISPHHLHGGDLMCVFSSVGRPAGGISGWRRADGPPGRGSQMLRGTKSAGKQRALRVTLALALGAATLTTAAATAAASPVLPAQADDRLVSSSDPALTEAFVDALGDRPLIATPSVDLDPSALAAINQTDLYAQAVTESHVEITDPQGNTWLIPMDTIAWVGPKL